MEPSAVLESQDFVLDDLLLEESLLQNDHQTSSDNNSSNKPISSIPPNFYIYAKELRAHKEQAAYLTQIQQQTMEDRKAMAEEDASFKKSMRDNEVSKDSSVFECVFLCLDREGNLLSNWINRDKTQYQNTTNHLEQELIQLFLGDGMQINDLKQKTIDISIKLDDEEILESPTLQQLIITIAKYFFGNNINSKNYDSQECIHKKYFIELQEMRDGIDNTIINTPSANETIKYDLNCRRAYFLYLLSLIPCSSMGGVFLQNITLVTFHLLFCEDFPFKNEITCLLEATIDEDTETILFKHIGKGLFDELNNVNVTTLKSLTFYSSFKNRPVMKSLQKRIAAAVLLYHLKLSGQKRLNHYILLSAEEFYTKGVNPILKCMVKLINRLHKKAKRSRTREVSSEKSPKKLKLIALQEEHEEQDEETDEEAEEEEQYDSEAIANALSILSTPSHADELISFRNIYDLLRLPKSNELNSKITDSNKIAFKLRNIFDLLPLLFSDVSVLTSGSKEETTIQSERNIITAQIKRLLFTNKCNVKDPLMKEKANQFVHFVETNFAYLDSSFSKEYTIPTVPCIKNQLDQFKIVITTTNIMKWICHLDCLFNANQILYPPQAIEQLLFALLHLPNPLLQDEVDYVDVKNGSIKVGMSNFAIQKLNVTLSTELKYYDNPRMTILHMIFHCLMKQVQSNTLQMIFNNTELKENLFDSLTHADTCPSAYFLLKFIVECSKEELKYAHKNTIKITETCFYKLFLIDQRTQLEAIQIVYKEYVSNCFWSTYGIIAETKYDVNSTDVFSNYDTQVYADLLTLLLVAKKSKSDRNALMNQIIVRLLETWNFLDQKADQSNLQNERSKLLKAINYLLDYFYKTHTNYTDEEISFRNCIKKILRNYILEYNEEMNVIQIRKDYL